MHFTALLITLLLDRLRPVAPLEAMFASLRNGLGGLARATWAGEAHNPWLAFVLIALPLVVVEVFLRGLLDGFGLLLDVVVLLLVARVADLLQWADRVARALDEERDADVAALLGESPLPLPSLPSQAAARGRVAVEVLLLTIHRRLFAPVFWYVLLPGCLGPLLYLLVCLVHESWTRPDAPPPYAHAARRILGWVDWLPARATALAVAVVGNFEDAAYAWRQQAGNWSVKEEGAILASAAGALGSGLGDPRRVTPEFVSAGGYEAATAVIRSALALVWRAIVLCFAALLLIGVGRVVG
jgi:cobalamin biosynthesis protein CobD/CbiB